MATAKASSLTKLLESLGPDPEVAIIQLQKDSAHLNFLRSLLPDVVMRGAREYLSEHPDTAQALPLLTWQALSNVELYESLHEAAGNYERLRRSLLGVQIFNESQKSQGEFLWPTSHALSSLSDVGGDVVGISVNIPSTNDATGSRAAAIAPFYPAVTTADSCQVTASASDALKAKGRY